MVFTRHPSDLGRGTNLLIGVSNQAACQETPVIYSLAVSFREIRSHLAVMDGLQQPGMASLGLISVRLGPFNQRLVERV